MKSEKSSYFTRIIQHSCCLFLNHKQFLFSYNLLRLNWALYFFCCGIYMHGPNISSDLGEGQGNNFFLIPIFLPEQIHLHHTPFLTVEKPAKSICTWQRCLCKAIPIKGFVSHRPTDPIFLKSKKKKNVPDLLLEKRIFKYKEYQPVFY